MQRTKPSSSPGPAILVPVDFSPASRSALLFGARLATWTKAPLKVLHVVHEPTDKPNYYQRRGKQDVTVPLEELAERMLGNFLGEIHRQNPDLDTLSSPDTLLVEGLPATRIPEIAKSIGASLVVMGHNQRKSVLKLFSISLSERLARKCSIPVTVVYPNGESEDVAAPTEPLPELDADLALQAGIR